MEEKELKICPLTLSRGSGEPGSPCLKEKCAWWITRPARKPFSSVTGEREGECAVVHIAVK